MASVNQVFKTESGRFLQVTSINTSGLHHFIEVFDNMSRTPVPELRNRAGHVTRRVKVAYLAETVLTFKKMKAL